MIGCLVSIVLLFGLPISSGFLHFLLYQSVGGAVSAGILCSANSIVVLFAIASGLASDERRKKSRPGIPEAADR